MSEPSRDADATPTDVRPLPTLPYESNKVADVQIRPMLSYQPVRPRLGPPISSATMSILLGLAAVWMSFRVVPWLSRDPDDHAWGLLLFPVGGLMALSGIRTHLLRLLAAARR